MQVGAAGVGVRPAGGAAGARPTNVFYNGAMKSELIHHGGRATVTGSCHELRVGDEALLVDCGQLQGDDATGESGIDFPILHVRAVVITHAHIDHVGRLPWLLEAGFTGPIVCSVATAALLPLVMEDAVKLGVTRNRRLVEQMVGRITAQTVGVERGVWFDLPFERAAVRVKFQPAGHVMGSSYVQVGVRAGGGAAQAAGRANEVGRATTAAGRVLAAGRGAEERFVFSGDLGAPYAPLLPAPKPPYRADVLVLESTYGDSLHPDRRYRRKALQAVIEHALRDGGTVLIPSFALGRTQELLYEIEAIIHAHGDARVSGCGRRWKDLEIIVDSPLAARFTEVFRELKPLWDAEARRRVRAGRHPLSFEQLYTVDSHAAHERAVQFYARTGKPSIVIAASGMCAGGRIVNWLKALIGDPRTDVVFVGYQAAGTPGRAILTYGPSGGYVVFDGQRYPIRAQIHRLSSYSAHADQAGLVRFAAGMRVKPRHIRLVHGEAEAQQALAEKLRQAIPGVVVD